MATDTQTKTKKDALSKQGTLNSCPKKVTAPLFQGSEFFDPHDLLQVKYEMLRHATKGAGSVTETAAAFGFSRVAFYQIRLRYDRYGLAGLLPKPRGPQRAHKLTAEVMDYIKEVQDQRKHITTKDLCEEVQSHFSITVHPRSIERALARRQKKR